MSETMPPQGQSQQPSLQHAMQPEPQAYMANDRGAARLAEKVALISEGDSGIGRAVAIGFDKEGADVAITYLDKHRDAEETLRLFEAIGQRGLMVAGDIGNSDFAREAVRLVVQAFGRIDVLVNNAREQHVQERLEDRPDDQLEQTFRSNIFSQFDLTRAVLPHRPDVGAILLS